jgi:hypothetical protein
VRAPCGAECHLHPGSALRLSQPLSGFIASSSHAALFRAATVRGVFPSEGSPRRNRAPLSRPLAPLRSSTGVRRRTRPSRVTDGFKRRPRPRARLPRFPADYEVPFHAPRRASQSLRARASRTVQFRQLHPLRSLIPPASPFAPGQVAPNRRSILSWVSILPRALPSTPWSLSDPPAPRRHGHRPLPKDRTRDSKDLAAPRARRDLTSSTRKPARASRRIPAP